MELDPRIILLTDIITCFDTDSEKARKTIGKKGYFSFRLGSFYDLSTCDYGTLDLIDTANRDDDHGSDDVFHRKENDCYYSFFIPESFLKPKPKKEKKYRPYTLNEFLKEFPVRTTITMRKKGDKDCVITCTCTGYRTRIICTDVCLGVEWISLGTLADEYEYQYMFSEIWKPFGVKLE